MMRQILSLSICLFLATFTVAQQQKQNWENPEVFAVNKENTRATSIPYPNDELALKDVYSSSPYYQLLDGMWKFKWVAKPAEIPTGFYADNYNARQWADMRVPGNWEFNGYGIPMYVNVGFGFKKNPPYIDKEDAPVGAYRTEFNIPADWSGRKVFLHFEGGTNAMYVWVNGKEVGYTENAKSPAEFDITPYLRQGKNTLACEVHKFSDGTYLEDQDMWRLGGINRSVYLYSTAQTRILDFFAHPDLDANYKNGVFSLDLTLKNYGATSANQVAEIAVLDKSGKKIFQKNEKINIPASGKSDLTFAGKISKVLKWTAETPNLYSLLITLKDEKGNVVESTSHKIGFRKIELKDGQILVNGKKVMFKGVNMHEFNYKTGQVVDREVMMRNIQLMKELNINAVRTSHYPQPPLWYQLCDEYGLYLVDEANLESHGLGYGPDNVSNFPEWHGAHMDRVIRLVERDKNHPSVIFWSLGNEASNGKAFYDMYDWAKARDNSRPVQYEQAHRERNTDVICPMYPRWEQMKRDAAADLGRPYIMCEYAHAMGNSMGNFQEYWDLMRASKNMQGGFIWEWYNHGYKTKDEQGREYWAYGGDLKGYNKPNDGNFCIDGMISPDQNYLPHTYIVKKVYQNILFKAKDLDAGIIAVINDYKFTDLTAKNYSYKWVLLKNGEKIAENNFTVQVPADTQKDVKLNLPKLNKEAGVEYFLQIFAYKNEATEFLPKGFEVAKEEFALSVNDYFVDKPTSGTLEKSESDNKITIKSGDVSYEFATKDKNRGWVSFSNKGQAVMKELPRLNFWRAMTDNDFGASAQYNLRLWDGAASKLIFKFKRIEEQDGAYILKYECKLAGIEAKVDLSYTINKDGSITTDANYKAMSDDLPEMVRFGMVMILDKDMNDFSWYGRGPHESYVDRKTDTFMGVYSGLVSEQAFPYIRPQETGNKMDVRWMTLKDNNGKGIRVEGKQPIAVNASNNRVEDLDPGMTKKQQHASDILPRNEVVLHVDLFQRGVAGLDSWGSHPFDEYRYFGKDYKYSYTISILK